MSMLIFFRLRREHSTICDRATLSMHASFNCMTSTKAPSDALIDSEGYVRRIDNHHQCCVVLPAVVAEYK